MLFVAFGLVMAFGFLPTEKVPERIRAAIVWASKCHSRSAGSFLSCRAVVSANWCRREKVEKVGVALAWQNRIRYNSHI